jgi:hypothetical protein
MNHDNINPDCEEQPQEREYSDEPSNLRLSYNANMIRDITYPPEYHFGSLSGGVVHGADS